MNSAKQPHIHIIGVAGCGMSGIALLAAQTGYTVSGSDRAQNVDILDTLQEQGVSLYAQDGSGVSTNVDFIVYSTAIESDNPDLVRAKELDIPSLHRAEMLKKLCENQSVIAIAGTAGKSTVTGLLGHIFTELGLDPSVYCGAAINHFGSSVRFGNGPWIIEADESDKSFLNFHPDHAIITNIAEDHFELSELIQLFAQFESQVSGTVIKQPESFDCLSPLLGAHNDENISNALTLCKALDLDLTACMQAVASFKGIERRLQRHGNRVLDDFAHSPIKIEAALTATAGEFGTFNAVWRPHGFAPLFNGLQGFIDAFSGDGTPLQHTLYILPVYYAGGTVTRKITSDDFVQKLQAAGVNAQLVADYTQLEEKLLADNRPVLFMGARDPEMPKFAQRIARQLD